MNLQELAQDLSKAQNLAEQAKQQVASIEQQIMELVGNKNFLSQFHLTTTFEFQVDAAALMAATIGWPAHLQPAYLAPVVNQDRLAKLMVNMPDLYAKILDSVEVKYEPRTTISLKG